MSAELDRVLSRLERPRRRGSRWTAKCPAHEDRNPSLTIGLGEGGRVLLHCFVGCSLASILAALNLTPRDLFPEHRGLPRSTYANGRRPWKS